MTQTPPANGNTPIQPIQPIPPIPAGMNPDELSDFDRQVMEAMAKRADVADPTQVTQPGIPDPSSGQEVPPLQAGGGDGGGTPPATSPADVQEGTTPQPTGLPEGITWDDIAGEYKIGNRTLPFEEAAKAVEAYDFIQSLQQDQINAINGVLTQQYMLVPATEAENIQRLYEEEYRRQQQSTLDPNSPFPSPSPPTPTVPGQGQPPSSPTVPAPAPSFNPDDYADPKLAQEMHQYMQQMNAQLQSLQAPLQQVQMTQEQQQQLQIQNQIEQGEALFQQQYQLDPADLLKVRQAFANSQTFGGYVQQAGGNYAEAAKRGLETYYWQVPELREAAIRKAAQEQATADMAAHQSQQQIANQQSALSGSGGSITRTDTPPDPRTLTEQQRMAALAGAIEKAQREGVWTAEHLGN